MKRLYVVEKKVRGIMLLDLRGQVTLGEATEMLRRRIGRLVEAGHSQIILNLAEVNYIDSVGLSTLVSSCMSARKQHGDLKLVSLTKNVLGVLQVTRLSTVFESYDTLDQAVESFARGSPPELR